MKKGIITFENKESYAAAIEILGERNIQVENSDGSFTLEFDDDAQLDDAIEQLRNHGLSIDEEKSNVDTNEESNLNFDNDFNRIMDLYNKIGAKR